MSIATIRVELRVSPEQHARWLREVRRKRWPSLAAWLKAQADKACEDEPMDKARERKGRKR